MALVVVGAVALAGCVGDDEPEGPSATVDSTPRATTTSPARTPEEEVEAAYLKSWDVYAEAMRTLDPAGIDALYADEALEDLRSEVERARQGNTPVRIEVDHDYGVRLLEPGLAVVVDNYVNHSVYLDPATGVPTEPDPNQRVTDMYTLKDFEGTWKVVSITRQ